MGPYTRAEADLNPLDLLLRAGYPAQRLQVLIGMRDPYATWASWRKVWGEQTSLGLFLRAYRRVKQIRERALEAALAVRTMVYEQYQSQGTDAVLKALRNGLGLAQGASPSGDWGDAPAYGTPDSHIVHPTEPAGFVADGVLDQVKSSQRLAFVARGQRVRMLPPGETLAIRTARMEQDYRQWRDLAEADFARWR